MPCNDCSREENCPPCSYEAPDPTPEGECPDGPGGEHCFEHDPDGECCYCDATTPVSGKKEAPEGEGCQHIGAEQTGGQLTPEHWSDFHCKDCGARWRRFWEREGEPSEVLPEGRIATSCREAGGRPRHPVTRRPPYAVAYAVEGQEPFEVLVPGDAVVAVLDGHLVIEHGTAVTAVLQVKPWGQPDA